MQYSPKLKGAMERIKQILEEQDIAAIVILHEPGFSEYYFEVDATYTCASIDPLGRIQLKTSPNDPQEVKQKQINDTVNMFTHFIQQGGDLMAACKLILDTLKKRFTVTVVPGDPSSNTQQNN